jgi:hypothetical protein
VFSRLGMKNPPTAVGGIRRSGLAVLFRLDMNKPSTAVGGIRGSGSLLCFLG